MSRLLTPLIPALLLSAACGGEPATGTSAGAARGAARPNVVLMTLDTTRADHLGCYGYGRDTSPNLDRLADEAVVHERAYSTTSWTLPAHASLFTGKFTTSHGARYDAEGPLRLTSGIDGPEVWDNYRARGLSRGETTLASVLSEAGYATGAVVAGPWMKAVFGLGLGFDHYDDEDIHSVSGRLAEEVTDAALGWIDGLELSGPDGAPFFLFLNYYDPHSPFGAPEPFTFEYLPPERRSRQALNERANWVDLYDGEIKYTDLHVGRLFDGLRERGAWDDTLVIVTADHGELFGEHGLWGHGESLSQEEIHVPMIVRYPGSRGAGRSDVPIQLVDVPALVLDLLELPLPPDALALGAHPIVAEVYPLELFIKTGDWRVLVEWPHKYMWNSKRGDALFDLESDPAERNERSRTEPARARDMRARLEAYLASLPAPGEAGPGGEVDPSIAEGLRNLGYLDGVGGD